MLYMRGRDGHLKDFLLMDIPRFHDDVTIVLRKAGWFPDRKVDISEWMHQLTVIGRFRPMDAAIDVLTEFGGISVREHGAGAECARETFDINPTVALGYESEFLSVGSVANDELFPVGQVGGGQVFLAVGMSGKAYFLMESAGLLGHTFDEALARLIEGRRPIAMFNFDMTIR